MMRIYRNFLLIAAFSASLSYGGWPGGYGGGGGGVDGITTSGGKVTSIELSSLGTIDWDGGSQVAQVAGNQLTLNSQGTAMFLNQAGTNRARLVSGGIQGGGASTALGLPEGASVATTKKVTFAGGLEIYNDTGAGAYFDLSNGASFADVEILPAAAGTIDLNTNSGTLVAQVRAASADWYFNTNATTASGKKLITPALQLTGTSSPPSDPADGSVVLWAPLDAAATTDNVVQVTDQASTDADFTHAAIDIEAP